MTPNCMVLSDPHKNINMYKNRKQSLIFESLQTRNDHTKNFKLQEFLNETWK